MNPLEFLDQSIRFGSLVFDFSWNDVLLQLALAAAVFFVLLFAARWSRNYIAKTTLSDERKDKLVRGIRLGMRVFYVVFLLALVSRFLDARYTRIIDDAIKAVRTPFYKAGSTEISILTVVLAVPVVYVAALVGRAAKLAFERSKAFTSNLAESRRHTVANLIRYSVMAVALIAGLSIIGIDLSAIAIILVVIGIGVGIGLQQVVASFFAGMVIVLNRPLKEGDFVRLTVGGAVHEGVVKQIRMLNSAIVTEQNETIIMPNAHFLHNAVRNLSYHEAHYLLVLEFQLAYGEDVEKAQAALSAIARRCKQWDGLAEPETPIQEFCLTGIRLQLRVALASAVEREAAVAWLNQEIYREFQKQKIAFAQSK